MESLQVKRRLSKAISNVAWYQLISYMEYKANENQVSIQKIDRWYPSSKTCSKPHSEQEYILSLRDKFSFTEPQFEQDRDINASLNILRESKILRQARME